MGIAEAFSRAADYDAHAGIQRTVADRLADHIMARRADSTPHVLEIGCGTGFLGDALIGRLSFADYLMTDIAPGMVQRVSDRFAGTPGVRFARMDGAAPDHGRPFDLICSSLALQWVADLPATVRSLRARLARNGMLAFTTLAAGSFAEWRSAHGGLVPGTPDYPSADRLRAMGLNVTTEMLVQQYPDGLAFLRALKAIGAGTPRPGHVPLTPAALRSVLARFDRSGATATYVIATCTADVLDPSA